MEEASTLQIGSVAFPLGQCTGPHLHPCHRLFDQDGNQDSSLTLPIVQTLLPVTFGYSLSSVAVVMSQLKWKRLWRRSFTCSHKRTSMGPSRSCWNGMSALQPEEITLKGLEFHVSTINKSAHTKKSGNLFNDPRISTLYTLSGKMVSWGCNIKKNFFFKKAKYTKFTFTFRKKNGWDFVFQVSSHCFKVYTIQILALTSYTLLNLHCEVL